jgi:hypothetical protein
MRARSSGAKMTSRLGSGARNQALFVATLSRDMAAVIRVKAFAEARRRGREAVARLLERFQRGEMLDALLS